MRAIETAGAAVAIALALGADALRAQDTRHPGPPYPGEMPAEFEDLGARPEVQAAIRDFYAIHAQERAGRCSALAVTDILSAPTIGYYRDTDAVALAVSYAYASRAADPGEALCSGIGTRVYMLRQTDDGRWRVVETGGEVVGG